MSSLCRDTNTNPNPVRSISIENIIAYKIFTLTDVGAAIAPSVVLSHGSNTIKLASVTMMHVNLVDEFMYTAYLQQNSEIHLRHQSHVALGLCCQTEHTKTCTFKTSFH